MSSSIHGSQEKKGCWIHSNILNQLVFVEDLPNTEDVKIYENPAFFQNDKEHVSNVATQQEQQSVPPSRSTSNTNVVAPENVAQQVPTSRSTSSSNERSSTSSGSSNSVQKVNGPKKGDLIVTTRKFQSSDRPSIQIIPGVVMKVEEARPDGNLKVDSKDWRLQHWISKFNVKYLRRHQVRKNLATKPRPRKQVREYILNRDAVMRSGPKFSAPVINNLSAGQIVLVDLKRYSKIVTVQHKGKQRKRILVKVNGNGNYGSGWISMTTEKGPMCRKKTGGKN